MQHTRAGGAPRSVVATARRRSSTGRRSHRASRGRLAALTSSSPRRGSTRASAARAGAARTRRRRTRSRPPTLRRCSQRFHPHARCPQRRCSASCMLLAQARRSLQCGQLRRWSSGSATQSHRFCASPPIVSLFAQSPPRAFAALAAAEASDTRRVRSSQCERMTAMALRCLLRRLSLSP